MSDTYVILYTVIYTKVDFYKLVTVMYVLASQAYGYINM